MWQTGFISEVSGLPILFETHAPHKKTQRCFESLADDMAGNFGLTLAAAFKNDGDFVHTGVTVVDRMKLEVHKKGIAGSADALEVHPVE